MCRRILPGLFLLGLALAAGAAGAQSGDTVVTTLGGRELLDLLRDQGVAPELGRDSEGDPTISFKVEGLKCVIFFYNCEHGRCRSFKYASGFSMKKKPSLAAVNAWNRERRFARAFLDDEQDPHLQMDVDLDGGVTRTHLVETLSTWRAVLTLFAERIASE